MIGIGLITTTLSFFGLGFIASYMNSNFLVLVPKMANASSIDQYHPVILGNFIYKVIVKILAYRLRSIARKMYASNQFGFIKGHNIEDCSVAATN